MLRFAPLPILLALAVLTVADADSLYTPTSTLRLCNALDPSFPDAQLAGNTACADTLAAGAVTPTTLTSDLAATNVYHDAQVIFTPAAATIAAGSSMPVGEKVGGVRSALTYGLLNAPCDMTLSVDFVLYNVALPNNPGDPRASTNIAYPRAPGSADRFGRWQIGSPAVGANNVTDADADLRADSSTLAIQNYPSILLDAFDPDFLPGNDGAVQPLVPHAVYGALSRFQNEWRIHYIVQFAAGQLTSLPGAFSEMTAGMGQPAVVVTGDPTTGLGGVSNITDTCAPSTTATMLLGQTPNGHQRYANPSPAGTHFTLVYNRSLRDLDQDAFENAIDTCPKNVNAGSPKAGTGDADGDGIDNICDATTSPPGDFDEDNDGFENRLDNCPIDANGGSAQVESELASASSNADQGPKQDNMGDVCDAGSVNATVNGRPVVFNLSPGVANGRYHTQTHTIPRCYGATDADGDGYCAAQDTYDGGMCETMSPPSCAVRHNAWGASTPMMQGLDTDNDTWTDAIETYLGTETTKACQQNPQYPTTTGGSNDEGPLDSWPIEFDDNGRASTIDIGTFVSRLNKTVNQTSDGNRHDLDSNGIVNTVDVARYVPVLSKRCDFPGISGMGFPSYNSQTQ